jgi:putative flippase GtrA
LPHEVTRAIRDATTLLRRILRYSFVGLSMSAAYSLAVVLLVRVMAPASPTVCSVLAFIVMMPIAFISHGRVSFSDRPRDAFQPMRFVVSTASSFVIAVGGMYWITEIAGRGYLLAIAWNWMAIPAMNFLIYLLWVFPREREREGVVQ